MKLVDKKDCTACGACASICPKDAISLDLRGGYYYPHVNPDLCVECGACIKACPMIDNKYSLLYNDEPEAYALCSKDFEVLKESTSGGAFTEIVRTFLESKESIAIYGAVNRDDLTPAQKRIDNFDEIDGLRKSKYVESYSGKIYREVKNDLIGGRYVVYSGTPCQIAGLKTYLGAPYNNLLTIEIICHGVPSTLLLKKYIDYREKKVHSKCCSIEYRSKVNSDWMNPKIRLEFENGKIYQQKSFASDDEYMIGFCRFLCLRQNCESCKFASPRRIADFTIGDFWGVESANLDISYKDGISLVLANTSKAKNLMPALEEICAVRHVDYSFARQYNQQLVSPAEADPEREQFVSDLSSLPFEALRRKYLKPRNRIINIMSNCLGRELKAKIKKLFGMSVTKY